jgi:hypothetical protein
MKTINFERKAAQMTVQSFMHCVELAIALTILGVVIYMTTLF